MRADAPAEQVMVTARETFESRDYLWERSGPLGPLTATASEGGKPISNLSVGFSQRLRVAVRVDVHENQLVLRQETLGAAHTSSGRTHHPPPARHAFQEAGESRP